MSDRHALAVCQLVLVRLPPATHLDDKQYEQHDTNFPALLLNLLDEVVRVVALNCGQRAEVGIAFDKGAEVEHAE